jgi:outer membrane protein insertion porin family
MKRVFSTLLVIVACSTPSLARAGQAPPPAQQVPAPQGAAPAQATFPDKVFGVPPPAPGGPTVLSGLELKFHPDNTPMVETNTYLYYIKSLPVVNNQWQPYNEAELLADYRRLWATNFLDNLWIEVLDEPFSNGVIGKHVIFHFEERQRVKIVDYEPHKIVDSAKIEEELRKRAINLRLDSFIDPQVIKKVTTAIRDLYGEKGYEYAEIKPEIVPMPGGPKLVHLTFNITPGPKVQIGKVDFVGNKAFKDGQLAGQMKANRAKNWLSFITSTGTYQEAKFADDAERLVAFYRDHGYIFARVGQPQLDVVRDSADKKTRYVALKIPVDEGDSYKVGKFEFSGNKVLKPEQLRPFFKIDPGEVYSEKKIRKGYEKAKELYGGAGYMEFLAFPEMDARCFDENTLKADPDCKPEDKGIVDVTLRLQEGEQYFVNRITLTGNTTTHDEVVRRELRLLENGVFNSEALKYSIRRLNQLGYFKPIEPTAGTVDVEKVPGATNRVNVGLKVEEQNRNQLTFGAGISQIDGFFGQLGFQTSNFLGRGETVSVNAQKGYRARNYELAITEPFLFNRPITAGVNVFSRQLDYINEFTQQTTGATATAGLPAGAWNRIYLAYSYQRVKVENVNAAYLNPTLLKNNPYLQDSLLIGQGGRRTVSKVSPSFVSSTINEPIFPSAGHKYTVGLDVAGPGGNTKYVTTSGEIIHYFKLTPRQSIGIRLQSQYIRPFGSTTLPIFEKIFIGGEYSIRGFDLRSVGPRDASTGLVLGGNKNLLFNAEYSVMVAGPVRVLAFFDAGQVRNVGQGFVWKEDVEKTTAPTTTLPLLYDPTVNLILSAADVAAATSTTTVIGRRDAFKTSTGLELRFFMPVVNVPFRLIAAFNPSRGGVLDNNLQFTKRFTFRFAVGTTF